MAGCYKGVGGKILQILLHAELKFVQDEVIHGKALRITFSPVIKCHLSDILRCDTPAAGCDTGCDTPGAEDLTV